MYFLSRSKRSPACVIAALVALVCWPVFAAPAPCCCTAILHSGISQLDTSDLDAKVAGTAQVDCCSSSSTCHDDLASIKEVGSCCQASTQTSTHRSNQSSCVAIADLSTCCGDGEGCCEDQTCCQATTVDQTSVIGQTRSSIDVDPDQLSILFETAFPTVPRKHAGTIDLSGFVLASAQDRCALNCRWLK